jgi:hypothetical protein
MLKAALNVHENVGIGEVQQINRLFETTTCWLRSKKIIDFLKG